MNYLEQIQRGVDYIENNIDQNVTFDAISKQAGMSLWHFQRVFKALTGETLKTYIRSRRLGLSLSHLANTNDRIIDIALNAGFETQESYSRAFKKAFDTTPAKYRSSGEKRYCFTKVKFDESYLEHINKGISMQPEIYKQREMTLVGLRTTFYGADSDKNNVSEKLPQLWQDFLPRLGEITNSTGEICYGVVRQLSENSDELEYYCAIEVDSKATLPEGMCAVKIDECEYAKFTHKGDVSKIDSTINYIFSTWLPQSGKRHAETTDLEFYGNEYDPVSSSSVMYYAIPVK